MHKYTSGQKQMMGYFSVPKINELQVMKRDVGLLNVYYQVKEDNLNKLYNV
jgi:hypothetical protein